MASIFLQRNGGDADRQAAGATYGLGKPQKEGEAQPAGIAVEPR